MIHQWLEGFFERETGFIDLSHVKKRQPKEYLFSSYGALDDFLKRYDPEKTFKIQMAGPYTIGKSILCSDQRPLIDHPDHYDDFVQFYIAKTAAFLKLFQVKKRMWIVFDEPWLDELSAKQLFFDLDRVIAEIEKKVDCSKFLFGLHSCNRWTPSLFSQFYKTGLNLMSFDVQLGGDAIFENRRKLFKYLKKGLLLWGIVPTNQKRHQSIPSDYFLRYLRTKNLQKREILNILRRSHFTPACGTALLRLKDEQSIARQLREISIEMRHYVERGS